MGWSTLKEATVYELKQCATCINLCVSLQPVYKPVW